MDQCLRRYVDDLLTAHMLLGYNLSINKFVVVHARRKSTASLKASLTCMVAMSIDSGMDLA
jgi:hypothetical protein